MTDGESRDPRINAFLERAALGTLALAVVLEVASAFAVTQLGSDGFHATLWIDAFADLVRHGIVRPVWLPHSYGGLGSPTFYFYPPLAYYIATPVRLLLPFLSSVAIYDLTSLLITVGSVMSFRYLLAQFALTRRRAWLGGVIYGFLPFRFYVIYTQSAFAEHAAFLWIPLVISGTVMLFRDGATEPWRGVLIVAVSWFLLSFTHVPTTAIMGVLLLAVGIAMLGKKHYVSAAWLALAVVIGSAMSAFYYLPVVELRTYSQLDRLQLVGSSLWDLPSVVPDLLHGNNFTENGQWLAAYFALVGSVLLLARKKVRGSYASYVLLVVGVICTFFITSTISSPVWRLLHFDALVQFTHRWFVPSMMVIAAGCALELYSRRAERLQSVLIVAVFGIAAFYAALAAFNVRAHARAPIRTPYDPPEYAPAIALMSPGEVVRFATAHDHDPLVQDLDGHNVDVKIIEEGPTREVFIVALPADGDVILHHWYWPTWKLLDGTRELRQTPDSTGRPHVALSAGEHHLVYALYTSTMERTGYWISLVATVLLVVLLWYLRSRRLILRPAAPAEMAVSRLPVSEGVPTHQ